MDNPNDNTPRKICTRCKNEYPCTPEYFYKSKLGRYGLSPACKQCMGHPFKLPDTYLALPEGYKRCNKCGQDKPATSEYFHTIKGKVYNPCRECHLAQRKQWHRGNSEKERQFAREYRNRPEVRERRKQVYRDWRLRNIDKARALSRKWWAARPEQNRAHVRAWCLANPEKKRAMDKRYYEENVERLREQGRQWRLRNKERIRLTNRRYKVENREKRREHHKRRRSRKANALHTFTPKHKALALEYFHNCCAICGHQLFDLFSTHHLAWDHWTPLVRGGHTTPDNMLPLCHGIGGCNTLKSSKLPIDWLNERYTPREAKRILARVKTYFEWIVQQD